MPNKKTQEQFVNELHLIHPNIEILGSYVNSGTKIKCKCLICNTIWNPYPRDILRGHGCPTCGIKSRANKRRKSYDKFIEEVSSVNPEIIIEGEYINSQTNIACRCAVCGHSWNPRPNDLLNGRGCPKCAGRPAKDTDIFISEIEKLNPSIKVLGEYINGHTGILVQCLTCGHMWEPEPSSLLSGRGCPKCAIAKNAALRTKTHEQFLADLSEINPNIAALEPYINSGTPIKCECMICHTVWSPRPNSLLSGEGCPNCGKKQGAEARKKPYELFVSELNKINPNIEVNGEYIDTHHNINCKCHICGYEWSPTPHSLLQGAGCPRCAGRPAKDTEYFINELKIINPEISVVGQYINNRTKIMVKCKRCGHEWPATPSHLLDNHGCPNCAHTSTSFMEQVLLLGLRKIFGKEAVLNRDRKAIGMELDIFMPTFSIALEPGSWYFHEKNIRRDAQKRKKASSKGICLITIYDSYFEDTPPFTTNCFAFPYDLRLEEGHISLKKILYYICSLTKVDYSFTDDVWESVIREAYSNSRKQTTEDFIKKLRKVTHTIEVVGEYEGSGVKILCRCKTCGHQWMITPSDLLHGYGCPKCAGNIKKTTEQFRDEIKVISPTISVLGEYKNVKTRISCKCDVCGYLWNPFPSVLLNGGGCPKCAGRPAKDTAYFINELSTINPDIEVLGEYSNNHSPIKVRCKICGIEWETSPKSLLKGRSHRGASKLHTKIE